MTTPDLFEGWTPEDVGPEALSPGAVHLRGFVRAEAAAVLAELDRVLAHAPLRTMQTPGGRSMSVATSNCGAWGWVSDAAGYRYAPADPLGGAAWPTMPWLWRTLAERAAATAGFRGFTPDACLINRYAPGARMGLHQDRDEADFTWPIVSFSFGLPAIFLFGGLRRGDPARRISLFHGDAVVWGGPSRLAFHGVAPVKPGEHPLTGACRINLTFRRA